MWSCAGERPIAIVSDDYESTEQQQQQQLALPATNAGSSSALETPADDVVVDWGWCSEALQGFTVPPTVPDALGDQGSKQASIAA
jgi:hypothetical protein